MSLESMLQIRMLMIGASGVQCGLSRVGVCFGLPLRAGVLGGKLEDFRFIVVFAADVLGTRISQEKRGGGGKEDS